MQNQTWNEKGRLVKDVVIFRDTDNNVKVINRLTDQVRGVLPDEEQLFISDEKRQAVGAAKTRVISALKANDLLSRDPLIRDIAVILGLSGS